MPAAAVAGRYGVDPDQGLSVAEAARRLEEFGRNELDAEPPIPVWRRFLAQFHDPLVYLLGAAIVISLIAWALDDGDEGPIEAFVIAAIVIANAVIGFWQEGRAIAAVDALQEMTSTRTTVVREGTVQSVASSELVPGDVVHFAEGDAVGADCRLLEVATLQIAEAPLTGESEAVTKQADPLPSEAELGDRSNMAYNGTAVVRGHAVGVVTSTGMSTEIGRIASMLDATADERTPLQAQIDWLGKVLGLVVLALAAIVVVTIVLTSEISTAADLVDALIVGVSLAVAAVPEGLPAILTVVLALGVQRMAKQRAIVKRLSSVETLGSSSAICTDKTGTLTRNEMTIVRVVTARVDADVTDLDVHYVDVHHVDRAGDRHGGEQRHEVVRVIEAGSLANDAAVTVLPDGSLEQVGDPTELAFLVAAHRLGVHTDDTAGQRTGQRIGELPFDADRKLMTTIDTRRVGERAVTTITTKGAPDVLVERCTHEYVGDEVVPLDEARRDEILSTVERLADDALRTLAVADREVDPRSSVVTEPTPDTTERALTFIGLVGMIDPPREEAGQAVADARRAGVRVLMITGDHPRTAQRIAESLGIGDDDPPPGDAVTGRQMTALDGDELPELVRARSVFARVTPEQKLQIVDALQTDGQIVAMTGDGVNDAPALRKADIGVAMGISGTEVSKEAADMILVDDNFATIVRAVREGREIFSDIRKFLRYLLACNAGEVLVVFLGVIFAGMLGLANTSEGLAVPLLATQILFINLATDGALALSLGVDPPVEDALDAPPRGVHDRVIDRTMVTTIALVGFVMAIAALIALDLELAGGLLGGDGDIVTARTMVFTTIVLAQIFNSFNARSSRVSAFVRPFENRLLWLAVVLTVVLQLLVVHTPPLQRAFDTTDLDIGQWAICWGLAATVLVAEELRKLFVRTAWRDRT